MNMENSVSRLSLERYNRGKVSSGERKCIEAALESDTQLRLLYEELKKSDGEIRLLYPLERYVEIAKTVGKSKTWVGKKLAAFRERARKELEEVVK